MIFEIYKLRLEHYFLDTHSNEKIPVEDPVVVGASYCKDFCGRADTLNEILNRMKQEVLLRMKVDEDWYRARYEKE